MLQRPPAFGLKLKSFDGAAAKAMPGIVDVLSFKNNVAIVGKTTWEVKKAREAVKIEWEKDGNLESTDDHNRLFKELMNSDKAEMRRKDWRLDERDHDRRPGRCGGRRGGAARRRRPRAGHQRRRPRPGLRRAGGPAQPGDHRHDPHLGGLPADRRHRGPGPPGVGEPGVGVRINWVWMPPWGPDKITDDGRDQLRALGFNV